MLNELLKQKDYLPLWQGTMTPDNWQARREELRELLQEYCYGYMPKACHVRGALLQSENKIAYAGTVTERCFKVQIDTPAGEFLLPVVLFIPKRCEKPPVLLHIAFRRELPDRYVPIEEITDRGFALAVVCYEDICLDSHDGNFSSGLAGLLLNGIERKNNTTGKIGIWAWAASRVLDWLYTVDEVDAAHTTVIGHSRLGKTALWAAAMDERFFCAISNDSGFGGAACARHGKGERVADFIRVGSADWFCENFKNDLDKEDERVFDQHFLLALIAPRLLCVGSATEDRGADPEAEFLSALTASSVWTMLGKKGLITPDRMPLPDETFDEGSIHYHLRKGMHFLSRNDWNRYMDFLKQKI